MTGRIPYSVYHQLSKRQIRANLDKQWERSTPTEVDTYGVIVGTQEAILQAFNHCFTDSSLVFDLVHQKDDPASGHSVPQWPARFQTV